MTVLECAIDTVFKLNPETKEAILYPNYKLRSLVVEMLHVADSRLDSVVKSCDQDDKHYIQIKTESAFDANEIIGKIHVLSREFAGWAPKSEAELTQETKNKDIKQVLNIGWDKYFGGLVIMTIKVKECERKYVFLQNVLECRKVYTCADCAHLLYEGDQIYLMGTKSTIDHVLGMFGSFLGIKKL